MNITDINKVFGEEPKKPFQYNLFLSYSKISEAEIFQQIKKIFITGVSLIKPSSFKNNHLQINKISLSSKRTAHLNFDEKKIIKDIIKFY